jgi:hypothetical protein
MKSHEHTRDEIEREAIRLFAVSRGVEVREAKSVWPYIIISEDFRRLAAERLTQEAHWREAIRGAKDAARAEERERACCILDGMYCSSQVPEFKSKIRALPVIRKDQK